MADMYNSNGIVDKTLYKYVAAPSDIDNFDVFYQRIVPQLAVTLTVMRTISIIGLRPLRLKTGTSFLRHLIIMI